MTPHIPLTQEERRQIQEQWDAAYMMDRDDNIPRLLADIAALEQQCDALRGLAQDLIDGKHPVTAALDRGFKPKETSDAE